MMSTIPLYQQIAESIRRDILDGRLHSGDRLPSVRQMTAHWNCTPGTVQRAYNELARQKLVISHAGQGTRVAGQAGEAIPATLPLRRAALTNRAEAFLLDALSGGFTPQEVEAALREALDRWEAVEQPAGRVEEAAGLRFSGSHDLALGWIAAHFDQICAGAVLRPHFTGSLGGLIALAEGRADLAGCHLWDAESETYNQPFVRRILPGQRVALVNLSARRLGLILPAGGSPRVRQLSDLGQPGLRFANRQRGSGTRVWLDTQLARLGIDPAELEARGEVYLTHSDVARAVAESRAECGLGLEAAARAYALDFVFLTREEYDLVIPAAVLEREPAQCLLGWLQSGALRASLARLEGYDFSAAGTLHWIE